MFDNTVRGFGLVFGGSLALVASLNAGPQGGGQPAASPGDRSTTASQVGPSRSAKDVVMAVARRQMHPLTDGEYRRGAWEEAKASRDPQGVSWVYPWGVTLLGLLRASEATGDKELAAFVVRHNEILGRYYEHLRWVQSSYGETHAQEVRSLIQASPIRRVMRIGSLDIAGAMSAQMTESFLRHGATPTPEQTELLQRTTAWVVSGQSRLPDGTFWRPDTNQTLWIDDLFMGCSLLTRWYERTGDRKLIDDAARQVLGMSSRQQDADGLWFHANLIGEKQVPPFKWGRANGWAMLATAEVLSALPEDHKDRPQVLAVFRKHVDGVRRLQAPSGLWRQVLDHPELWEEMSATGMFAFSIARAARRGWLPPQDLAIAEKAFAGMMRNVSQDGQVAETCEGTLIGRELSYYANRRRPLDDWHAPGPVLLAGSELLAAREDLAARQGTRTPAAGRR
jgi:rhamnogalacturonyl hydrolase YesR